MAKLAAWVQAARLLAQANLAVPLILGQALAFWAHGEFSWTLFAWVQVFSVADQLFIVFANDVADAPTDRDNTTHGPYSGGSRVLVEGKLSPQQLLIGSGVAAAVMVGVCLYLGVAHGRWWALAGAGAAMLLFWAYSFSPIKLSYRGHGELLQGLGIGVVLPVFGYYVQAGTFDGFPWPALFPLFLLGFVGNIITSLPDYPSDLRGEKRSYAVRKGQFAARRHALELLAVAALLGALVVPGLPWFAYVPMAALPIGILVSAWRLLGSADAENREECHVFVTTAAAVLNATLLVWIIAAVAARLVG